MRRTFTLFLFFVFCFSGLGVAPVQAETTTTFVVNTVMDSDDAHPGDGVCADSSAQCSLRAALQEVNVLPAGDRLVQVAAGSYQLSITGSLNLLKPVTISNTSGLLAQIRGENDPGNAINVQANVTLNNITLSNFDTALIVSTASTLTCNHCTLQFNQRGIEVDAFYGGNPQVNLNNSIVSNNKGSSCVGALVEAGTHLYASQSYFTDNNFIHGDTTRGGTLCNEGGNLTLNFSTIAYNNRTDPDLRIYGGALYQTKGNTLITWGSIIEENRAGYGGGVYALGGMLTINRDSEVRDNFAQGGDGGGLYLNYDSIATLRSLTVNLEHALVSANQAESGGGILHAFGALTINNSAIYNNSAIKENNNNQEKGGGLLSSVVDSNASPLVISNTTISANLANNSGGGLHLTGVNAQLSNLTISNNRCDNNGDEPSATGGGIYIANTATVNMRNSILAGNSDPTGTVRAHDLSGTLISAGYNLIGECNVLFCSVTGDTTGNLKGIPSSPIDAKLDALTLEGDLHSTWYHPLQADSPAVNGANVGGCRNPAGELLLIDQLGKQRTLQNRCDMGAVESAYEPALNLSSLSLSPNSVVGGAIISGSVTLTRPAPSGGIIVNLSSNHLAASLPATLSVPAGASVQNFNIQTAAVSAPTQVTISASLNSITLTTTLSLNTEGTGSTHQVFIPLVVR